ncbi:hypothetical protein HMPREF9597_01229 [Cutibacterium acnes HL005PA4]|nr:hypothetical protein HMPREF9597_01229 [Cutibacterium acnes HL005PA4]EFS99908.1 hypothetical protein HMPREF9609_01432 [Cutibacterium acnes HL027PA1]EFT73479.1 hypothetical protein HMPREF9592_02056 [Cutibacterium acnes HL046PA1]EGF66771.1 hypothetical protein HMPREF9588_02233 [Cutibacterium acnes HL025PA2]
MGTRPHHPTIPVVPRTGARGACDVAYETRYRSGRSSSTGKSAMNPLGLARRLRRDLIAAGPPRRGIPRGEEGTTRNSCTSGSGGVGIRLDDSSGGQHHRGLNWW